MKNVHEVLQQKELEVSRVEKEVEALRVAAPLLSEDDEDSHNPAVTLESSGMQSQGSQAAPALNQEVPGSYRR